MGLAYRCEDSMDFVSHPSMLCQRRAAYCCAFTGNAISSSASVGLLIARIIVSFQFVAGILVNVEELFGAVHHRLCIGLGRKTKEDGQGILFLLMWYRAVVVSVSFVEKNCTRKKLLL